MVIFSLFLIACVSRHAVWPDQFRELGTEKDASLRCLSDPTVDENLSDERRDSQSLSKRSDAIVGRVDNPLIVLRPCG